MIASEMDVLMAALRVYALAKGGDICDRCGEVIWPEFELVRCDFCVGKYGAPEEGRLQEAYKKHQVRIAAFDREIRESFYEENQ